MKSDRYLKALRREPVDCTPVWVMRQAGRYLPEYRAVREKAGSFMALATNPELACEVTLQPLERFDLDAAILFSDILTIPDAMGLGLYFEAGEGPKFEKPLTDVADIEALTVPDMHDTLGYVRDAVSLIRRELDGRVPLIGFSGSPWTLACYMIEQRGKDRFANIRRFALSHPAAMQKLLDVLTDSVIEYLKMQVEAGVQAVQVFDSWGGILTPAGYKQWSLPSLTRIAKTLRAETDVPIVLFGRGSEPHLADLADTGAYGVGLDWNADAAKARALVGDRVALQGNLDPAVLLTDETVLRREVQAVLDAFGDQPGHVFNLGHGITPEVDPGMMKALVDAVHELSTKT